MGKVKTMKKIPMLRPTAWDSDSSEIHPVSLNFFPILNSFVQLHHLDYIGETGSQSESAVLFMREETLDCLKELRKIPENSSAKYPVTLIESCPGMGKSTTLLLFIQLCMMDIEPGGMAIWCNVPLRKYICFRKKKKGQVKLYATQQGACSLEKFCELINVNLEGVKYFIFDGVAEKPETLLIPELCYLQDHKDMQIYLTTSMGYYVETKFIPCHRTLFVQPWKLETYNFMLNDRVYFDSVVSVLVDDRITSTCNINCGELYDNRASLIAAKYEYAGHSCRWMLCYSYSQMVKHMNR